MITHTTSCKFKFPATADSKNNDSIGAFKKSLCRKIVRKSITLKFKSRREAPVRLIIKNAEEVLLTTWTLNRVRSTDVHVEKLGNLRGAITSVWVGQLRAFADNARNTAVTKMIPFT
jgi:hypothetical protein